MNQEHSLSPKALMCVSIESRDDSENTEDMIFS